MNEQLLQRITTNPEIFNGKPIIRGHPLAIEHILGMLAAGDTFETLLAGYPWLEREDLQACMLYALNLLEQVPFQPSLAQLKRLAPEVVKQAPYLKLLVLFGSRATGKCTTKSDWDFAILCDEALRKQYENTPFSQFRIWTILEQVFEIKDDKVDVVDLKNVPELLAHAIARDGIVIYTSESDLFQSFQHKHLKTPSELDRINQDLHDRIQAKLQEFGV